MNNQDPMFLYVEDDMMSRKVMEMMLKRVMGYQKLTLFEDSADFLNRMMALPERPYVIFLDVQIAPVDGYGMLGMLRQSEQFADATIVAMTANVMSHDIDALQQAGFDGLIGKPVMKEVIPDLV